ncbi:MAG: glycosyl hydrolase family 31, partial [Prevotella sp.]|nr:glycosyl hydrolase family 31 [Prevotella sp.]
MQKCIIILSFLVCTCLGAKAQKAFGQGEITIKQVARNAVRITYNEKGTKKLPALPDWLYVKHDEVPNSDITVSIDSKHQVISIKNKSGKTVFKATRHQLINGGALMSFNSSKDEYLYGL